MVWVVGGFLRLGFDVETDAGDDAICFVVVGLLAIGADEVGNTGEGESGCSPSKYWLVGIRKNSLLCAERSALLDHFQYPKTGRSDVEFDQLADRAACQQCVDLLRPLHRQYVLAT